MTYSKNMLLHNHQIPLNLFCRTKHMPHFLQYIRLYVETCIHEYTCGKLVFILGGGGILLYQPSLMSRSRKNDWMRNLHSELPRATMSRQSFYLTILIWPSFKSNIIELDNNRMNWIIIVHYVRNNSIWTRIIKDLILFNSSFTLCRLQ